MQLGDFFSLSSSMHANERILSQIKNRAIKFNYEMAGLTIPVLEKKPH
jgi:hypothetical protein